MPSSPLYAKTRLTDLARRRALFQASAAELSRSGDAMVDLALALWPVHEEIDARDDAMAGALLRVRPRLIAGGAWRRARRWHRMPTVPCASSMDGWRAMPPGMAWSPSPDDGAGGAPQGHGRGPFDSPPRLLEKARAGEFGPYADPDLGNPAGELPHHQQRDQRELRLGHAERLGELAGLASTPTSRR